MRRYGLISNGVFYTHDGEGRRVMKFESSSGQRTIYVYDTEGELAAEYRTDNPIKGRTLRHQRRRR